MSAVITESSAKAITLTANNYLVSHTDGPSPGYMVEASIEGYLSTALGGDSLEVFFSRLYNISDASPHNVFLAWGVICARTGRFTDGLRICTVLGQNSVPPRERSSEGVVDEFGSMKFEPPPAYSLLGLAPYHAHAIRLKAECLRGLGALDVALECAKQGVEFCAVYGVPEMIPQLQALVDELGPRVSAPPLSEAQGSLEPSLPKPIRILSGVDQICGAVDLPREQWDIVKRYNDKFDGPIKSKGAGHSPLVDEKELLVWWNGIPAMVDQMKSAEKNESPLRSVPSGRKGEIILDNNLRVKPRRKPQSSDSVPE